MQLTSVDAGLTVCQGFHSLPYLPHTHFYSTSEKGFNIFKPIFQMWMPGSGVVKQPVQDHAGSSRDPESSMASRTGLWYVDSYLPPSGVLVAHTGGLKAI